MIDRLKALLQGRDGRPADGGDGHDDEELRLAAAALLVEAALGDGNFDAQAREVIEARLDVHLGHSEAETAALVVAILAGCQAPKPTLIHQVA